MSEVVRFWALAEGLGLLALPVATAFFGRLPGNGLALARPLGLLLAAYPAWLLASLHLLPYGTGSAWLGILLLALLAGSLAYRGRAGYRRPRRGSGGTGTLPLWLAGELIFSAAFFAWAVLRSYAPDVWGTEKPMDMAFINAINRSAWFPPNDPWLSGASINYYYLGHYLTAFLIRLTAVSPTVGFNLGVSLFYALSAGAVYGVAASLYAALRDHAGAPAISPVLPGLLAAGFAMLLGNLTGALELLSKPGPLLSFDWWSPSRVILNTITEFPLFSFLLADLHAHMMAAPFGLTALAFALQLALTGPRLPRWFVAGPAAALQSPWDQRERTPATATATGDLREQDRFGSSARQSSGRSSPVEASSSRSAPLEVGGRAVAMSASVAFTVAAAPPSPSTVGTVAVKEAPAGAATPAATGTPLHVTWLPVLAELLLAALVAGSLYALNGWDYPTELGIGYCCLLLWWSRGGVPWPVVALWAAGWTVLSFLLFLPFYVHFRSPAHGIGLVQHTDGLLQFLHDYLLIYGLPAWVVGAAYLTRLRGSGIAAKHVAWAVIAGLTVLALLTSAHLAGLALLLAAAAYAASAAADDQQAQAERFWWLLVAVAIGLAAVGEVVYVRDAFDGGADYRMNTVFKFGYQAWFLLMIAAGCGVAWSRRWLRRDTWLLWLTGLVFLSACSAVYTVAGSDAREGGFRATRTLDGLGWLAEKAPGDVAAIRWLQAHVVGAPTIVEAVGEQYDPTGHARFSTFTGLPAVVGWAGHEGEWGHSVGSRPDDVKALYTTTDEALARSIIARYHIEYVIVGSLERTDFPAAGLAKFAQLGTPVFSDGGTIVYKIR